MALFRCTQMVLKRQSQGSSERQQTSNQPHLRASLFCPCICGLSAVLLATRTKITCHLKGNSFTTYIKLLWIGNCRARGHNSGLANITRDRTLSV